MALFNRFVIKDFTKERYLALVRSHPKLTDERTQIYLMLTLTFAALSFLGLFAISPTLTTIVELNRKLADSEFVSEALKTKIANLSSLNTQYEILNNSLPLIDNAVPNNPRVVTVLGQVKAIALASGVKLIDLQSFEVELSKISQKKSALPKDASFVFTATAEGSTDNLLIFVNTVAAFDRVVAIEAVNYSNEDKQTVTIRGRIFFTP